MVKTKLKCKVCDTILQAGNYAGVQIDMLNHLVIEHKAEWKEYGKSVHKLDRKMWVLAKEKERLQLYEKVK